MNKIPSVVLIGVCLGLSLGGCRKSAEETDKDKPAADTKTATTAEPKKAARPQPPVDEGIDVPTEDDFEDSASAQITDTSDLKKELDQLEKEIGK
jgi:hypothetical protein